jgi:hypothetical protein
MEAALAGGVNAGKPAKRNGFFAVAFSAAQAVVLVGQLRGVLRLSLLRSLIVRSGRRIFCARRVIANCGNKESPILAAVRADIQASFSLNRRRFGFPQRRFFVRRETL